MNLRQLLTLDLRTLVLGDSAPTLQSPPSSQQVSLHLPQHHRWRDLLTVTNQLLMILHANLPLAEGLEASMRDVKNFRLKRILASLEIDLASGFSLSEAMRRRARFFPAYYIDLVKAGEETGSLEPAMNDLRELLEQTHRLRVRAAEYAMYLGWVWLTVAAVSWGVARYLLPSLSAILGDFVDSVGLGVQSAGNASVGLKLAAIPEVTPFQAPYNSLAPWSLNILLGLSSRLERLFHSPQQVLGLVALGVLAAAVVYFLMTPLIHRRGPSLVLGWLRLHLPVLGGLSRQRSLGHAALVLERMLRARIPVDESLSALSELRINPVFAEAFRRARERVRAGNTLKDALQTERVFPASFVGMAALGEASGLMPEAFGRVGRLYHRQLLKQKRILLDLLSPLALVAAGGVVLLFFSAVFGTLVTLANGLADNI